ncbi:MAG: transposase, partial [Mariprofundales bacterium]
MKALIDYLQRARFGSKADKVIYNDKQLRFSFIFNEAEALADIAPEEDAVEVVPEHTRRKRGGRRKLPENLIHETLVHDLSEEEKVCSDCGETMTQIGVDSTEKLEYQPASLKVIIHERPKYGCRCCECAPKQAKPEPQAIPKGMATASLLAYILISKFIDATPLYRQEKQWKRLGIDLGRSLLSSWVMKCGTLMLVLWELMQQEMREYDLIQA